MLPDKESPFRVLVVHYSQTGQLDDVAKAVVSPLVQSDLCDVSFLNIQPVKAYPFPWPFVRFLNSFPEAVYEKGCDIKPIPDEIFQDYDLIVLGYQVWFLAPSNPITEFLHSDAAERLMRDKPVVTVIACRNMWLQAQERVKAHLQRMNAELVGNIALTDEGGAGYSFLSTPLWMWTGKKGPFAFGIPKAGVSEEEIGNSSRFGDALLSYVSEKRPLDDKVFRGLGAVKINVNQIASEKIATRSFKIWGKLFLKCGGQEVFLRKVLVFAYAAFLITLICTVVPINYVVKRLLAPFMKASNEKLKLYYAAPSGESVDKL